MMLQKYMQLYDDVLEISFDMAGVSICGDASEEEINKCKWIAAIFEVLNDVPKRKMEMMFKCKNINFDYVKFIQSKI